MSDFDKDPSFDTFVSVPTTIPLSLVPPTPTLVAIVSEPSSLVTQMKRECFGNTYSLNAFYEKSTLNCIINKRVSFSFDNATVDTPADAMDFEISYTVEDDRVVILSATFGPSIGSNGVLSSTSEVNTFWNSTPENQDPVNQGFTLQTTYDTPNVQYSIVLENITLDVDPVVTVTVTQNAITYIEAEKLLNLRTVYGGDDWQGVPLINILSTTEFYYGRNLGQVGFDLLRSKECCLSKNGDVKYNNNITQQSDYPKLTKVVAGDGNTLIEKVFYLASKYQPTMLKITFLSLLVTYGILRYYLWKLINGCFDITILYRDRTEEFVQGLKATVYGQYKQVFLETDIKGFGNYFLYTAPKHCKKTESDDEDCSLSCGSEEDQ